MTALVAAETDPKKDHGEWSAPALLVLPDDPDYLSKLTSYAALLHTNEVLFWSRVNTDQRWVASMPIQPLSYAVSTLTPDGTSLLGAAHVYIPEGRLLIAGGRMAATNASHNHVEIYDPVTYSWCDEDPMVGGDPGYEGQRQQATAQLISDEEVAVWGGRYVVPQPQGPGLAVSNQSVEIYNFVTGDCDVLTSDWAVTGDPLDPQYPLVPKLHYWNGMNFAPYGGTGGQYQGKSTVLRDPGSGWNWDHTYLEFGGSGDPAPVYQLGVQSVSVLLGRNFNDLPTYTHEVLVFGGKDVGAQTISNASQVYKANAQFKEWLATGPMNIARTQHNGVLLPDGTVLAVGGTTAQNTQSEADLALKPEVFNPQTGTWKLLNPSPALQGKRWYYHCSLLLPDATVMCAGGRYFDDGMQGDADDDPTYQLYYPPYLFHGARPVILSAPTTDIDYGSEFLVQFDPTVTLTINHVVLMRPGTIANQGNFDQRCLELQFYDADGILHVTAPPDNRDCPPGYYMLFLLVDRPWGAETIRVPSVSKWVEIKDLP